ncbi:MAG: T9SS type A sorting domain-containing protein [Calditrichaeota bacterium]|nr:T9SS type A sorting domain-containing protein [Calditrichota bacterium]
MRRNRTIWLVVIGLILTAATVFARGTEKPLAVPFDGTTFEPTFAVMTADRSLDALGAPVDWDAAVIAGGDYLKGMQADVTDDNAGNGTNGVNESPDDPDDGGWDWVITSPPAPFHHSTTASPTNIYGVTVLGVYDSYVKNGYTTAHPWFTTMTDAANAMIVNPNIRSGSDLKFLMLYNDLSGVAGTTYMDAAKTKYDARITTYGSATGLAEYIRDARHGQGYDNGIIAWDVGVWAVVAQMLYDRYGGTYDLDADAIAEVLYKDSYQLNPGYFDLATCANWDGVSNAVSYYWFNIGISGLMDAFMASNTYAAELPALATYLLQSQGPEGGICDSHPYHAGDYSWQATAYGTLSLNTYDALTYATEIAHAAYFIGATQDVSGGWLYGGGNHYPEIGGENLSAMTLSAAADEVWVDDDWTTQADVDASPYAGLVFGYDAFGDIQSAIDNVGNSIVNVLAGTYVAPSQIVIDQDLTLIGAGSSLTTIVPGYNTTNGSYLISDALIYVAYDRTVTIEDLAVDGTGYTVKHAIQSRGASLTVNDCEFRDIYAHNYDGRGIVFLTGAGQVNGCSMSNVQRIGVHVRGSVEPTAPNVAIDDLTYVGKGAGDFLDYGVEFGGGGTGSVTNSSITNCLGLALTDSSTSAAILATDFYGTGTNATITGCTLTGNTTGIYVGYASGDMTTLVAENNDLSGNETGLVNVTTNTVDASPNWWGDRYPFNDFTGSVTFYPCWAQVGMTSLFPTTPVADAGWYPYIIRAASGGQGVPYISGNDTYVPDALEYITWSSGQKAGLGTDLINGATVSQISTLHIDRLDDINISGSLYGPYINIWITDGNGNYAVIANEPSNPEWAGSTWDVPDWDFLKTKTCKVYETIGTSGGNPGTSWLAAHIGISGPITFEDVAGLIIMPPPIAYIQGGNGVGTGAPDELGTDIARGFNWIFGDTGSNYVSGSGEGFVVDNYSATANIPPTSFTLSFDNPYLGCDAPCETELLKVAFDLPNFVTGTVVITLPTDIVADWTGDQYQIMVPALERSTNLNFMNAAGGGTSTITLDVSWSPPYSTGTPGEYIAWLPIKNVGTANSGTYPVTIASYDYWDRYFVQFDGTPNSLDFTLPDVLVDCEAPTATLTGGGGEGYPACDAYSSDAEFENALTYTITNGGTPASALTVTEIVLTNSNGGSPYVYPVAPGGGTFPPASVWADMAEGCNTFVLNVTDGTCNSYSTASLVVEKDTQAPAPAVTYTQSACYNNLPGDPQYGGTLIETDLDIDLAAAGACEAGTFDLTLTILAETVNAYTAVASITDYPSAGLEASTLWSAIVTAVGATYTGSVTVNWTATDCAGNSANGSFPIPCMDFDTPDNAFTYFDARPAHLGVWLAWSWEASADAIEARIYRSPLSGEYPGYVSDLWSSLGNYDVANFPPSLGGAWQLVATQNALTGTITSAAYGVNNPRGDFHSHVDGGTTYWLDAQTGWVDGNGNANTYRDIYRYVTFVKDAGGNWSISEPVVLLQNADRSTNYWLGDFATADDTGDPSSRGRVDNWDLDLLSLVYFTPAGGYRNIGPVNPVENGNVGKGIPNPDGTGLINFQDLVPFSFNYANVSPVGGLKEFSIQPDPADARPFSALDEAPVVDLTVENELETLTEGTEFTTVIALRGNDGNSVKAVEAVLSFDENMLEVVSAVSGGAHGQGTVFTKAAELTTESGRIGFVAASCGGWTTLEGDAVLGTVTFRVKSTITTACELTLSSVNMLDNTGEVLELEGATATLFGAPTLPESYALYQNYPNPFNPTTNIRFDLVESGHVSIMVYNTLGQLVARAADQYMEAGRHTITFDASSMASGVYVYSISVNGFTDLKKMVLIR